MNRKLMMIGFICAFLLITGICYSCAYYRNRNAVDYTDLSEDRLIQETESENDAEAVIPTQPQTKAVDSVYKASKEDETAAVCVHICGAVKEAGVYELEEGKRIVDLIELAGGLTETAAGDYINQAQYVSDGQRIYIPTMEEVKGISAIDDSLLRLNQEESDHRNDLVNINTADDKELMTLPGIGQAKADQIIAYRSSQGSFHTIEELMNVNGIKEGLFSRISEKITVQ